MKSAFGVVHKNYGMSCKPKGKLKKVKVSKAMPWNSAAKLTKLENKGQDYGKMAARFGRGHKDTQWVYNAGRPVGKKRQAAYERGAKKGFTTNLKKV